MAALPLELWIEIFSLCSSKDLCRLSSVSPHLLSVVRMVLYRDIELNVQEPDNLRTFSAMLGLLRSPPFVVSGYIQCLNLKNFNGLTSPMVPFEHMPNLGSLSVVNCLAFIMTSGDLQAFVYKINTYCSSLRKIHFDWEHSNFYGNFSIPGITHITWKETVRDSGDRGVLPPFLMSLCRASQSSIINLSVHLGRMPKLRTFFDDIHFPALLSLDTALSHSPQDDHLHFPSCMATFISRHHSLENLRLHYAWHKRTNASTPLFAQDVPILPHLTHLDAHPALIAFFLEKRAPFMMRLPSLSISDGLYVLTRTFLLVAFNCWKTYNKEYGSGPGLGSVRHLQLLPRVRASGKLNLVHHEFMDVMKDVYSTLPRLESLEVDIPDQDIMQLATPVLISASQLVQVFSPFRHLRELSIYSPLTTPHSVTVKSSQGSDIIEELANNCFVLEVIEVGYQVGAIHTRCVISRDEDSTVRLQYMNV